ncbi:MULTISPECIES: sensor histidine kinase [Eubacterium]|jgi:two-component system sensor histidine kinase YesM|uniref:sensor histidine kinase n=1 Tax=Eubacterium TaxID=1730 RepID=UPI000E4F8470|nr:MULTISPECIES: sensor histidine kinase [Eubacterium]MBS5620856.1 sensor histidine kinase [Eubacterium sp.]RGF48730.1 sensor histidine kinase [Eubacterium sp. AF36-5BH]
MNREDEKMHSEKPWNKKIQNKKVPSGKEKIHKRYSIKKGLKERKGSLIIKIMAAIIIGVVLISQINILLVNKFSKDFFSEVYGDSQEKNIEKIQEDLEEYFGSIEKTFDNISTSYDINMYYSGKNSSSVDKFIAMHNMQKSFQNAFESKLSGTTVLLVSKEGEISVNNNDVLTKEWKEIKQNEVFNEARKNNRKLCYSYVDEGFTYATKSSSIILGVKALRNMNNKLYGYGVILIPDSELDNFYRYGENQYNSISIIDSNGMIVSSTDKYQIGETDTELQKITNEMLEKEITVEKMEKNAKTNMVLCKKIPYVDYSLCFTVDANEAIESLYNISTLMWYIAIITGAVLLVIYILVRRTMSPLRQLGRKMSYVAKGDFNQYAEVTGDGEIQELAKSYNRMLHDINHYVDSIIEIQKQKRQAEIHALQMQINPHYIYNTLTSIKWLIMQGDTVKSTKAIDAFIKLLRSTISKSDEYISVEEEIENLKNYMYINEIRYGEKIKTEFFISINEPDQLMIPKMILQPFIENAFFHGFPEGQNGEIFVCVREKAEKLIVEIIDNGVGMDERQVNELENGKSSRKSEHFTGIGINNIRDRLKLIYENQYELKIKSSLGEGTTVTVVLPIQHKEI